MEAAPGKWLRSESERIVANTNNSGLQIKNARWYAAGPEMEFTRALLCDGAFILYVYLCLHSAEERFV